MPEAPVVGRYESSRWGFSTVSYWLEGPTGVVLVDTQFLPSAAAELVETAERATGKPVVTAIVLHANPDKFNGTATLQARGIEVITSSQVLAQIPAVHDERTAAFAERYAPDYPTAVPRPDSFGDTTTTLERAGLSLTLHVLGAGCSTAHVALEWQGHLFVGDLVAERAHSWMELGLSASWRARLGELAALQPQWVHPGRGGSGSAALLHAEADYLCRVETLVDAAREAATRDGHEPTAAEIDQALACVRQTLERDYPDYAYAVFLRIGLPAMWRRAETGVHEPG